MDKWLYPEELGEDLVVNLCKDLDGYFVNVYELPNNWRDVVTKDKGKDGKPSIHDIMTEAT